MSYIAAICGLLVRALCSRLTSQDAAVVIKGRVLEDFYYKIRLVGLNKNNGKKTHTSTDVARKKQDVGR
jgi:hypothetical protein